MSCLGSLKTNCGSRDLERGNHGQRGIKNGSATASATEISAIGAGARGSADQTQFSTRDGIGPHRMEQTILPSHVLSPEFPPTTQVRME